MSSIEIIRTERRRRYSEAEKLALLAEVDRGGSTVAEVGWGAVAFGTVADRGVLKRAIALNQVRAAE